MHVSGHKLQSSVKSMGIEIVIIIIFGSSSKTMLLGRIYAIHAIRL